ncbi:P-loop containing nucleoside triphosphate hydrolase protein [Chytridium lagenaria]|nr:P-loop containing nucleoside triphosphate hydrolase protein [Chytridium lagenaria]
MASDIPVGVEDFVLLNEITEDSVCDNLRVRFQNDKIYTFIGNVVVAVNPYKPIDIYTDAWVRKYQGTNIYEMSPHMYGQLAIRAGKTEASKILMRYIAAVSRQSEGVEKVRDQLLNCNPVLEAFGNAKTTKNDNSSRFKSPRVVAVPEKERSFHIFYQLLSGLSTEELSNLGLTPQVRDYSYLIPQIPQSQSFGPSAPLQIRESATSPVVVTVTSPDDSEGGTRTLTDSRAFQHTLDSLETLGISAEDRSEIWKVLAAVLLLGNIRFDASKPGWINATDTAASLLGTSPSDLAKGLTYRSIYDPATKKDISVPLSPEQAMYARDAFAKSLYGRLFNWLIKKINEHIMSQSNIKGRRNVIGVLDIYGFEIMARNGFEQLMINYCNEKLQQLFIELTLKSEQEEYAKEGIEWTEIKYFNNAIICDLIESKRTGILAVLDDECAMSENTDTTFLSRLNNVAVHHKHFDSREKNPRTSRLTPDVFIIHHYAGDVSYCTDGFLEKNKDLLYRDLVNLGAASSRAIVRDLYPVAQPGAEDSTSQTHSKRPETLGSQFKASMASLIELLMSKNPHYIRCIKPNASKTAGLFEPELVLHQIRYLGLQESVRVRRSGFCYRQKYAKFLDRFKMLSPLTWPKWKGAAIPVGSELVIEGVKAVFEALKIGAAEWKLGKTKDIYKESVNGNELVSLETSRNAAKHRLATLIRARWLAYKAQKEYQRVRAVLIKLQANIRRYQYHLKYLRLKKSTIILQKIQRGRRARKFVKYKRTRIPKYAATMIQRNYRRHRNLRYLNNLITRMREAGVHWRTMKWPKPPSGRGMKILAETLRVTYDRCLARNYRRGLSAERREYLRWKVVAWELFRNKESYAGSTQKGFSADRVGLTSPECSSKWAQVSNGEPLLSAISCIKLHRHNPTKDAPRILALTPTTLHLLNPKNLSSKKKCLSRNS